MSKQQLLIMERNGYPEETYYTFSYSPMPDDDGSAGGIICANTDDTQRVLGERQLALLRDLAARPPNARTWQRGLRAQRRSALATNTARPAVRAALRRSNRTATRLTLVGASASQRTIRRAPPIAALDASEPVADRGRAARSHDARVVTILTQLFDAPLPTGAWERRADRARSSCRSLRAGETGRAGVLIVGLNPFRLFDDRLSRLSRSGRRPDRRRDRQRRRPTKRSAGAPKRWPKSIAPRPRSSPTSATSSARRSR